MIMKTNVISSICVNTLKDLPKLKFFMEVNNLKVNKSEIARQLNVDRRTVNKYINGYEKSKTRNKSSYLNCYYGIIKELLSSNTQIFYYRRVLYQYLVDNYAMKAPEQTFYHYIKSISEFDSYFTKGKVSNSVANPIIRFETAPGEQAQLDWKESIPFVLADTAETIDVNIMTLLLSHSRHRIYKLSLKTNREMLMHLLTEAFEELGGVPKTILTDNMKTVMDEPRTKYKKGKVNNAFEAFAKEYGFEVKPCIAASPQTKGKIEAPMKILDEIRAYSGKLTLIELYELTEKINNRVNCTLNQGSGRIPVIDFEKEKDSLLPLPHEKVRNQYRISTKEVKVNPSAMISVKSNLYSVPIEYKGKTVTYQIFDDTEAIYTIQETDGSGRILSQIYYYFNDLTGQWEILSGDSIYSVFEQTKDGFYLKGNVIIDGNTVQLKNIKFDASDIPVLVRYSIDGKEWHEHYDAQNDIYMRISADGGANWGEPIKITASDAAVTPENVFNAMTKNDEHGLFSAFYDDKTRLFINAEYIRAGTLAGMKFTDINNDICSLSLDNRNVVINGVSEPNAANMTLTTTKTGEKFFIVADAYSSATNSYLAYLIIHNNIIGWGDSNGFNPMGNWNFSEADDIVFDKKKLSCLESTLQLSGGTLNIGAYENTATGETIRGNLSADNSIINMTNCPWISFAWSKDISLVNVKNGSDGGGIDFSDSRVIFNNTEANFTRSTFDFGNSTIDFTNATINGLSNYYIFA